MANKHPFTSIEIQQLFLKIHIQLARSWDWGGRW